MSDLTGHISWEPCGMFRYGGLVSDFKIIGTRREALGK
jgi:hypothetical protein